MSSYLVTVQISHDSAVIAKQCSYSMTVQLSPNSAVILITVLLSHLQLSHDSAVIS